MAAAFIEHRLLIETIADMEAGLVVLTLEDYRTLPAVFWDARRIFRTVKSEMEKPPNPVVT